MLGQFLGILRICVVKIEILRSWASFWYGQIKFASTFEPLGTGIAKYNHNFWKVFCKLANSNWKSFFLADAARKMSMKRQGIIISHEKYDQFWRKVCPEIRLWPGFVCTIYTIFIIYKHEKHNLHYLWALKAFFALCKRTKNIKNSILSSFYSTKTFHGSAT